MLTRRAPRQQQNRNVSAPDQQQQCHCGEQQEEGPADPIDELIVQSFEHHVEMLGKVARRFLCKLFEQGLELCTCRRPRDSWLEPSHDEESSRRIGCEFERQIDFAVAPSEARLDHADDRVALVD